MASQEISSEYENGLRILARWIARAHLKALAKQEKTLSQLPENQLTAGNYQATIPDEEDTCEGQLAYPKKLLHRTSKRPKKLSTSVTTRTEAKD